MVMSISAVLPSAFFTCTTRPVPLGRIDELGISKTPVRCAVIVSTVAVMPTKTRGSSSVKSIRAV